MPGRLNRGQLPEAERRLRSQLAALVSGWPFVRATLAERERVCGKPGSRCARGQRHRSLYLVVSEQGKVQQLFIPRTLEPEARRWVETYQEIRRLLDALSRRYWDKLKRREL